MLQSLVEDGVQGVDEQPLVTTVLLNVALNFFQNFLIREKLKYLFKKNV